MPWVKLNDNVARHPKIAGLSDRAFRVWIEAICYACEFLTDGVLPSTFLVAVPRRAFEELMAAGLWVERDGTLTIHDYLKHQSSRAHVEAERRRNTDRRTGGVPAVHDSGTPPGVPRKNRDQKIEVQKVQEIPPNPPAVAGGLKVRREHKEQAKLILRSRLGYCQHDPQCMNQAICLDLIALELARKGIAS